MVKRLLIGAAAGAGAVYLLDPDTGPGRRRHALRIWADKNDELLQTAGRAAGTASTLSSRAQGDATGTVGDLVAGRSKDPNTATGDVSEHVVAG